MPRRSSRQMTQRQPSHHYLYCTVDNFLCGATYAVTFLDHLLKNVTAGASELVALKIASVIYSAVNQIRDQARRQNEHSASRRTITQETRLRAHCDGTEGFLFTEPGQSVLDDLLLIVCH